VVWPLQPPSAGGRPPRSRAGVCPRRGAGRRGAALPPTRRGRGGHGSCLDARLSVAAAGGARDLILSAHISTIKQVGNQELDMCHKRPACKKRRAPPAWWTMDAGRRAGGERATGPTHDGWRRRRRRGGGHRSRPPTAVPPPPGRATEGTRSRARPRGATAAMQAPSGRPKGTMQAPSPWGKGGAKRAPRIPPPVGGVTQSVGGAVAPPRGRCGARHAPRPPPAHRRRARAVATGRLAPSGGHPPPMRAGGARRPAVTVYGGRLHVGRGARGGTADAHVGGARKVRGGEARARALLREDPTGARGGGVICGLGTPAGLYKRGGTPAS